MNQRSRCGNIEYDDDTYNEKDGIILEEMKKPFSGKEGNALEEIEKKPFQKNNKLMIAIIGGVLTVLIGVMIGIISIVVLSNENGAGNPTSTSTMTSESKTPKKKYTSPMRKPLHQSQRMQLILSM